MASAKEKEAEELRAVEEEAARRQAEEKKRAEEERIATAARIAAEKEFLEKHHRERKLSSGRATLNPGGLPGTGHTSQSATSSQADSESDVEGRKRKKKEESPESKEKRVNRRKTDDPNPDDMEVDFVDDSGDSLKNLSLVLRRMREWWKQPTICKMVTKPQTEKFAKYLLSFEEELIKAREERVGLETRVEERKVIVDIVRETVREEMERGRVEEVPRQSFSYADIAAKRASEVPKVTGVKGPVMPAPKLVMVRQDGKESEEVRATLKKLVKPAEIGLKVRRLTNIRNGVVVEAETAEGAESLLKLRSLQDAGLKVEKPTKKKPNIMIYDVSAELKDEEIMNEVFTRNLHGCDIEEENFKGEFSVRHKYQDIKSAGKRNHIVVECSVRVRNWLRAKEKVFIEWQACRVKDYVDVARCFKCQRYGHIAKHCNSVKPCCSCCAGEHDYKDCPNKKKKESLCCANCKREGRPHNKHDAASKLCPSYEKAVKRLNEKIDYGL